MYEAVTRSIRVRVEPTYLPDRSSPDEGYYFWAYTVEIMNLGHVAVQLRSRLWKLTNSTGYTHEIRGKGVVGEEPRIAPGENFRYTSAAPLDTPSGIMSGSYQMETEDGEFFNVEIPAFSLDPPRMKRSLN